MGLVFSLLLNTQYNKVFVVFFSLPFFHSTFLRASKFARINVEPCKFNGKSDRDSKVKQSERNVEIKYNMQLMISSMVLKKNAMKQ